MAFLGFQCRPNDLHFSFKLAPASVVSSNRTECQNENNVSDFVSDHVLCDFWLRCSRFAKKIYQKNVVVCQFFTDSVHHTVSIHHRLRGYWKKAYCWFNSEKVQYNFLNNVQVIQNYKIIILAHSTKWTFPSCHIANITLIQIALVSKYITLYHFPLINLSNNT